MDVEPPLHTAVQEVAAPGRAGRAEAASSAGRAPFEPATAVHPPLAASQSGISFESKNLRRICHCTEI
jgi:hypothetical protein